MFTAHLIEAGIDASIGTVGDALDNALMESTIWPGQDRADQERRALAQPGDVELATADYVD